LFHVAIKLSSDKIPAMMQRSMEQARTVGFDMDMTLARTRPGILAALAATAEETGTAINTEGVMASSTSPTIPAVFAELFSEDRGKAALGIFRRHMEILVPRTAERLPGADRAVEVVRRLGGRAIVLTTSHTSLAIATLQHVGVEVDTVIGGLAAEQKAEALEAAGAWGYVGDHIYDMKAANMAGVCAIGVTSGACTAEELWQAGADEVFGTLEEFPDFYTSSFQR
jgi:phosphoglycolate phosphatase